MNYSSTVQMLDRGRKKERRNEGREGRGGEEKREEEEGMVRVGRRGGR